MIFLFLLIFLAVVCAILFVRALPYLLVIGFIIWAVTAIHGQAICPNGETPVPGHCACRTQAGTIVSSVFACQGPDQTPLISSASGSPSFEAAPDKASIPASDVLQLCGAHAIKDVVCDEARRLERKYHNPPCWETNKC